jgi:hypothetical protein
MTAATFSTHLAQSCAAFRFTAAFCLITLPSLAQQVPPRALPVEDDAPIPKAIPCARRRKRSRCWTIRKSGPAPPKTKGTGR